MNNQDIKTETFDIPTGYKVLNTYEEGDKLHIQYAEIGINPGSVITFTNRCFMKGVFPDDICIGTVIEKLKFTDGTPYLRVQGIYCVHGDKIRDRLHCVNDKYYCIDDIPANIISYNPSIKNKYHEKLKEDDYEFSHTHKNVIPSMCDINAGDIIYTIELDCMRVFEYKVGVTISAEELFEITSNFNIFKSKKAAEDALDGIKKLFLYSRHI